MRVKKVLVAALAMLFATTSCVSIVTAHEDGVPMIITEPEDPNEPIPCAVFFADNMVFTPQWRTDGLVRIEMMIIDMTDFDSDPMQIDSESINLPLSWYEDNDLAEDPYVVDGVPNQQRLLLDYPDELGETSMVSVSYICVTITQVTEISDDGPHTETFEAGWLADDPYTRVINSELGREVNKHGNLIYGMLWDTANPEDPDNPAPAGNYRVDVQLGKTVPEGEGYVGEIGTWYSVDFAVGHLYVGDGELLSDEHPYVSLVPSPEDDKTITILDEDGAPVELSLYADLGIGLGGIRSIGPQPAAWILLGPLIPQGPGGGNGGDGGSHGEDGDGNNHCGDQSGGNSHGGSRYRSK